MDELVKMLLDGKSDRDILNRIHQLEATQNFSVDNENSSDEKDKNSPNDNTSRPSTTTKSQGKLWKEEAMQKDNLIVLKEKRTRSHNDIANEYDSDISLSIRSDSEMEPRSFSEIRKRMQIKRHTNHGLSTPRSEVSSISEVSSVRTEVPSLIIANKPMQGVLEIKSDIRLPPETTLDPMLSVMSKLSLHNAEDPFSSLEHTQSLNMPIINSPRKGVTAMSTLSTPRTEVPPVTISGTSTPALLDQSRVSEDLNSVPSCSTPGRYRADVPEPDDYKASVYSDSEDDTPVLRYDSNLSVNTVVERIQSSEQDISNTDTDNSNSTSPRDFPLRRTGSYTLDKPSPLLQAHLIKFGSDDDFLDMSQSDRHHIEIESQKKSDTFSKVEIQNDVPVSGDLITTALYSELNEFTRNVPHRISNENAAIISKEVTYPNYNIESLTLSSDIDDNGSTIFSATDDEISKSQTHIKEVFNPIINLDSVDIDDSEITETTVDSFFVKNQQFIPATKIITSTEKDHNLTARNLEERVQNLADNYVRDLKALLKKQEEERVHLRMEFERKQKELVEQIIGQFPNLQSFDKENIAPVPESTKLLDNNQIILKTESNKELDDKVEETKNIMETPRKALEPRYEKAWTKLTALARGFLVRRLMATEKVQSLKRTIKDTVACAVKLHLDSGVNGKHSAEDLELHSRLIVQLESACASFHTIFFKLGIHERMAILALDREAKKRKMNRPATSPDEKKITTVTRNRLEKQKSLPAVTKGRQVLRKLQVSSPYQDTFFSSQHTKPKKENQSLDKTRSKTSQDERLLNVNNNKVEKIPDKMLKKVTPVVALKRSPKKPAWK